MNENKKKHLHIQIMAVAILAILIAGTLVFPNFLKKDSTLMPLEFIIVEQSGEDEVVFLRGSFSGDLAEGEKLWLYAENAEIEINISEFRERFNERGNVPSMFRSPGSGWYSVTVPEIRAGEPIEFTIRSYYNKSSNAAEKMLRRLYTGDGSGLLQLMLQEINFFSMVLIFAMIVGVLYMAEGVIGIALGISKEGVRIALFGLYCFSGGLWCVTDVAYPYLTLVVSPPWMAALLDMAGMLLFPIALALMLRYYMRSCLNRRIMHDILMVEIITAVVCLIFQFTGKADLIEQQIFIGIVAIISLLIAMISMMLEMKKYRDNYLLLLFLTVLPVFIGEILDGINVICPFMQPRVLMQYSFAISILLLGFQLASYANTERIKKEALQKMECELTDLRISVMLSQIRPHFLYNSLVGIKQLCDAEPKKASDALDHFSYYLRGNLNSIYDSKIIPFEKEIEHVKDYLYLEKMRFSNCINILWEIDFTDFLLPPLTLQPIVENAVRHGIVKKEDGGTINIRSWVTVKEVLVSITDDGVGFDTTAALDDTGPRIGIRNVKKRLEVQCGGSLEIKSVPGVGTEVIIILPRGEKI